VSFTYDDDVLDARGLNRRNVAVAIPKAVTVSRGHPRNHDGEYFSAVVTRTTPHPTPGSDEISRAFEDAWVGDSSIAFQGMVLTAGGRAISEVFIVDLPGDLSQVGDGPLEGTETEMPFPPAGVVQRRLTFTADREYPGIQGPRHWLRSSPDGSRIAFLMKDDRGIVQIFTVLPVGGDAVQLTRNDDSIASAFTWSSDGSLIAHVMDNSVCVTDTASGETRRVTERSEDGVAPRPEAVVFSPDGKRIAYVRRIVSGINTFNQIFCATI
jgi:hypothetical protein